MPSWFASSVTYWCLGALVATVGLALLVRGVVGHRAKGRPRCRRCFYDMTGASSLTCPECGHAHRDPAALLKPRRYWKRAALGVCLLAFIMYCLFWPEVRERQSDGREAWYESIVPTTAWIVALPWLSEKHVYLLLNRLPYDGEDRDWDGSGSKGSWSYFNDTQLNPQPGLADWQADLFVRQIGVYLRDPGKDPLMRPFLFSYVCALRNQSTRAVEMMIDAVRNDPDPEVRDWAITNLATVSPRPGNLIELARDALRDPDPLVRDGAALTIGFLGQDAVELAAELLEEWFRARDSGDSFSRDQVRPMSIGGGNSISAGGSPESALIRMGPALGPVLWRRLAVGTTEIWDDRSRLIFGLLESMGRDAAGLLPPLRAWAEQIEDDYDWFSAAKLYRLIEAIETDVRYAEEEKAEGQNKDR